MITPAAKQPQISPLDWAGDPQQRPQWVGFCTSASLPANLQWSGRGEVPAIGGRVHIHMNSIGPRGESVLSRRGLFGVLCQPDKMPEHLATHGVTLGHFFGRELEPYTHGPAAPAQVPEVVEVSSQEYRVIPAPLYYRHLHTSRITVVYGRQADYYGF